MTKAIAGRPGARLAFSLGIVTIALMALADLLSLPGGASVGQMAMFASMPVWLMACLARRDTVFAPTSRPLIGAVLSFAAFLVAWSIISATMNGELLRAGRVLVTQVGAFAMILFVAGTMTDDRLRLTLTTIALAVGGISVLSIAAYLFSPLTELIFQDTDRAHGTFKHPNQYGIVLSTTIPPAVAMIAVSHGRRRTVLIAAALVMLGGLMLSGSKTNLLITAASTIGLLFAIVAISLRGEYRLIALLAVAGVALGALFGLYIALDALNPRALDILTDFFTGRGEVQSLNQRAFIYTTSFETFAANPIFGAGAGTPLLIDPSGDTIQHSHNVLLDYARGMGLPGAVAMTLLLAVIAVALFGTLGAILFGASGRLDDRILGLSLCASVVNYTAANFVSESFGPSTSMFFWLSVALMFFIRGRFHAPAPYRPRGYAVPA